MASADDVCYVEVLGFGFARFFVVVCASWPLAFLAVVAEYPYEVWPSDSVTPPLVLYGAPAALRDRLCGCNGMLSALVLYSVVGKKCIAATFYFTGALHATGLAVGTAVAHRSRCCQCTRPAHLS